ncbi:hypothetical protein HDU82_003700 [Entophlyctis luteolus]|nr:hypothetical protein HDU82_003700 [Entophlyctis luteolus]KAJ3392777.1 hypothetical protein HDU84_003515 [Entophlyctis sp. JEL0112]
MAPTIAVMPATSRSGLACVQALAALRGDAHVRFVTRRASYDKPLPANASVVANADAAAPVNELAERAFKGCTAALIVTTHDYSAGIAEDAENTANMIRAAVVAGVQYIVLVGSWTVHHPVALSALASRFLGPEALLKSLEAESGIKWTVLRGGYFAENVLMQVPKINAGEDVVCTKAEFSPIDVANIGQCAAVCLSEGPDRHHAKCYEMSGPEALSSEEMIKTLADAMGKKVNVRVVPASEVAGPEYMKQLFVLAENTEGCTSPFNADVGGLIGDAKWTRFGDWARKAVSALGQK